MQYDVDRFAEKNRDVLVPELVVLMQETKPPVPCQPYPCRVNHTEHRFLYLTLTLALIPIYP